jgi:predicted TIM-barrel fold metal-dependent hydrolase
MYHLYSKYPKRFDVWCGFDMTGMNEPGFGPAAVKELERCRKAGAVGVGEIGDKGRGIGGVMPTGPVGWPGDSRNRAPMTGPHPDDARMDSLWEKCAQLGMPVNLHMSDPYWSYLPQDKHNDGLMNGFSWRLDDKPDILGHNELIETLERTAKRHPKTVFIACHFANLDYDLTRLGQMFDRNPNLYADISARFAETAPIPRFAAAFYRKYAHRLCYGTDMPYNQRMFSTTFRVLESQDEHFYEQDLYFNFDYHWPMHGLGLPDEVLKKVYRDTALAAFAQP